METIGPHVRTIPVRCAPSQAPCPTCGKLARRKATHHRRVRSLAYKQVVFLDVTYGEYRARWVRTNNHVERADRKLRRQERARYKWRKRRRIARFLVLLLDRWWG